MSGNERDCGCHEEAHESHHEGCGCREGAHEGHHWHHMGFGFPLMSIEDEVKVLEKMKTVFEKRLEIVNKRLEVLKRSA